MSAKKVTHVRKYEYEVVAIESSTGSEFYRRRWNSNKSEPEWYREDWFGWVKVQDYAELEKLYEEWDS